MTIRYVEFHGAPRARGRAHGEALRDTIQEHMALWAEALHDDLGMAPEAYLDAFFADTDFMPAIKRWTPDVLDEVWGISEGAGQDFRLTLARQLSDEEPWWRRERRFDVASGLGCTSIGRDARLDRPALVAQNMDTPRWYDGHQMVMTVSGGAGLRAMLVTVAGKVSLCGMNEAGLAIACNTLSQLDFSRDGLPEDFVVRGFLQHRTLDDGVAFLRGVRHASGQNYTVGAPGERVLNLEASAGEVVAWRPYEDADRVFHANHPLANPDRGLFEARRASLDAAGERRDYSGTSAERFAVLEARLGDPAVDVTDDLVRAVLSDRTAPISRAASRAPDGHRDNFTLACVLMELSDAPRMHVAGGPPCSTAFQTFGF